ncbi:hypothetical protein ACI6Q2_13955 [Chitinophagaceae bacterium LWZ2-11]
MLIILTSAAILCFLAHVGLLVSAFIGKDFSNIRYFYSHVTLWITGVLVFIMALLYQGENKSAFLDYFDTPLKKVMILVATLALSFVAHTIIRFIRTRSGSYNQAK